MTVLLVLISVCCLAYANGANDNFKGVATLFGTGTARYRTALTWATVATLLGSLTAVLLAEQLLKNFTGKGLVDDRLTASETYVSAVAMGAALTVLLATRLGMPISTTHSLVGALVGAGWASGSAINFHKLSTTFVAPLLFSPFVAVALTSTCYLLFRSVRRRLGIVEESCICVGNEVVEVVPLADSAVALQRVEQLTVNIGNNVSCRSRYRGRILGLQASTALDSLHYLSAGVVSFARGLNDTPKIAAALLLIAPQIAAFNSTTLVALSTALVGVLIATGGLLSARRVAETMSQKITPMNHGQGFSANLITGLVVLSASRFGMPVSTTHVSCGALFGIGTATGRADWTMIRKILAAWITTLPVAAALAAAAFSAMRSF